MDEITASDLIKSNTKAYGKSILCNHFPSPIDGLKCVKRRVIYAQPIEGSISGLQLTGNAAKIHPYGDGSIYDAACRMTDTFRNSMPLITLESKGNSYGGDKASAARYTKFHISDFCKDIFYHGINFKTIPSIITEDLSGREIAYFIPKVPTALLYGNETIGFGFGSRTVPLKFENICDLVIDFVKCKDKPAWNFKNLAHLFIPSLPMEVFIKNQEDLITSYKKGVFTTPIETEGLYEIMSSNSVEIRTLSYGASPDAIRANLTAASKDKDHWVCKQEIDVNFFSQNKTYLDIEITAKRGTNILAIIDDLKALLQIRRPVSVINNYVLNECMVNADPPQIIQLWYKERYRSVFGGKKHKLFDLQYDKIRLETYLIICGYVDEVVAIIKNNNTVDEVHKKFEERFKLTLRQTNIILASNLKMLMKSKKEELEADYQNLLNEIEIINESFLHIDEEICKEVKSLKKKHKTDMSFSSSVRQVIGCLLIDNYGAIQISTLKEAIDLAKKFPSNSRVIWYQQKNIRGIKFTHRGNIYEHLSELPYSVSNPSISIQYQGLPYLFTRSSGKSQIADNGSLITVTRDIINAVSNNPLVITKNGIIKKAPEELFKSRNYNTDILYSFDPIVDCDEYIVASVNEAHPTVIRFQNVKLNQKVMFSGAGETAVIGVLPSGTNEALFNMPYFHKRSLLYVTDIVKSTKKEKVSDINIRNMTYA